MISEKDVINILCKEPFCVFYGSGVSLDVGLPTGKDLGIKILKALGLSQEKAEAYAKEYHLERMLYILSLILGENICEVYSVLDTQNYGSNHVALAQLCTEKKIPLITTNQDELVEKASGNKICNNNLIKLHGTLSDIESLSVTLDRVSSLPPEKSDLIFNITKNLKILVIGYSFSDYDLKNFFLSCKNRIFYCAYNSDDQNKFKELLGSDSAFFFDKHCIDLEKDASGNVSFLSKLAKSLGLAFADLSIDKDEIIKSIDLKLFKWSQQYNELFLKMAVGRLGKGLWESDSTLNSMRNLAKNEKTPPFYRAFCYAEASNAAEALNEYKLQLVLLDKLKKLPKVNKSVKSFFYLLYKAAYYHIQDNPISCIRGLHCYRAANRYFLKLANLDLDVEQRFIIKSYKKTIDHGIASTLEKLNRIIFSQKRFNEAMDIIKIYVYNNKINCDLDFLCEILFIRAKLYVSVKEYESAEKDYSQAYDIAIWIKKRHSIQQALRGLCRVYGIIGKYECAISCIKKSDKIITDEPLLYARNNLTLSWLHRKISKEYSRKGKDVYKKTKRKIRGSIDAYIYLKTR